MDSSKTTLRIKIIQDILNPSLTNVLVAHNGYSYDCVQLRNKNELRKLIQALQNYIISNNEVELEFDYETHDA